MLLGRVMVARQRERGMLSRTEEGEVDQVPHAGVHSSVDHGQVLLDSVPALRGGHHENGVDAEAGTEQRLTITVRTLDNSGAR